MGQGYNARTDVYEDMIQAGIVDPAKVTRSALQNAASIASMILTTESLVADVTKEQPMPMDGGMGGMSKFITVFIVKLRISFSETIYKLFYWGIFLCYQRNLK